MKISWESRILAVICFADMMSTLWLVKMGAAAEANPIMRFYLNLGAIWFLLAKSLLFVGPIYLLEMMRRRHPLPIQRALRLGIVLYLVCYAIGGWKANTPDDIPSGPTIQIVKHPANE